MASTDSAGSHRRPVAVVTGASRGIGRAIATRLARDYHVVATARSVRALEALAAAIASEGGTCTPVAVDLRDGPAVARALGSLDADVIVNNAGVMTKKPFLELTPDEWHEMVDVNLNGLYHATRAVLPSMVARGSGHIVIIGSIAGRSVFAGGTCYTATKHAVMGFSESLLLEVRHSGVKVSVIMPGSVATDMAGSDAADWMLGADDVAAAVGQVLATAPAVLIHRLEIRALKPPRKG